MDDTAQVDIHNAIPIPEFVQPRFADDANSRAVKDVVQASQGPKRVFDQTLRGWEMCFVLI